MTDWDLIKTQYEILGRDVKELCEVHHVTPEKIEYAIESGKWSVPTTNPTAISSANPTTTTASLAADPAPINGSMAETETELERLSAEASLLQAKHQNSLMPKYIEIESVFLSRLKSQAGDFTEAGEAKLLADTLAVIKPSIMKQADAKSAKIAEGSLGGRIMVVNQFPVPQPGDTEYIAPNAVLVGNAARDQSGRDFTTVEVEIVPDREEMN